MVAREVATIRFAVTNRLHVLIAVKPFRKFYRVEVTGVEPAR